MIFTTSDLRYSRLCCCAVSVIPRSHDEAGWTSELVEWLVERWSSTNQAFKLAWWVLDECLSKRLLSNIFHIASIYWAASKSQLSRSQLSAWRVSDECSTSTRRASFIMLAGYGPKWTVHCCNLQPTELSFGCSSRTRRTAIYMAYSFDCVTGWLWEWWWL